MTVMTDDSLEVRGAIRCHCGVE